jgi:hypothetical protein
MPELLVVGLTAIQPKVIEPREAIASSFRGESIWSRITYIDDISAISFISSVDSFLLPISALNFA